MIHAKSIISFQKCKWDPISKFSIDFSISICILMCHKQFSLSFIKRPEDGLCWPKLVPHIQYYKLCQTVINIFYWLLTITQRDALYKKLLDAVWFCYRRHASCFNMLVFPQSKDQFFRWRYLKCLTERTTDVTFSGIAECFSASWCKTSLSWPNMSRKRRNI